MHEVQADRGVPAGVKVVAGEAIPADTVVISIPFDLAITPQLARASLTKILGASPPDEWSERQAIASYLVFHWILPASDDADGSFGALKHRSYVDVLPHRDTLRTPLHFTREELECLKGTNLYGATDDRRKEWIAEWEDCLSFIKSCALSEAVVSGCSWEHYLTASTHISSRAFPSTVLTPDPSLLPTSESHPILLPGIDSLNHARGQPVSWLVSDPKPGALSSSLRISLALHYSSEIGAELLNNYGPKPNAELILGYGFAIPDNPDDTIVLKIGGAPESESASKKWEVGRKAAGVEGVWEVVLHAVVGVAGEGYGQDDLEEMDEEETYENELNAADTLQSMVVSLIARLPQVEDLPRDASVRPDVRQMVEWYVQGQRDILRSIADFADAKLRDVLHRAAEAGIDLGVEDEGEVMDVIGEEQEEDGDGEDDS